MSARLTKRWRTDRSENNVLMAIFMACWQWLTSRATHAIPLPAPPHERPALTALPAARPRFVLLASIHVPWPRSTRFTADPR